MSAHVTPPTPYPEVNELLHVLLSGVQTILGNHFIGMYLSGSLTSGDFDQDSDVDVVAVTDAEIPVDLFLALEAMHATSYLAFDMRLAVTIRERRSRDTWIRC